MKSTEKKFGYESPKMEVIEIKVEQGFATSNSNENWEIDDDVIELS